MATRADPSGPFTEVSRFDDGIVNTAGGEAWGTITSDRKTLIFARSPARQGSGDLLWIATRPRSVGPFDDSRPLDEINVGFTKIVGQRLSPDGGTLLFTARSPVDGNYDIWVSLRSENNEFSRPVRLEEQFVGSQVNSPSYHEHSPSMSSDSLTLFFSDTWLEPLRPGGSGVADIWMSTRSSPDSAFESVVNLRELSLAPVNSGTYDLQPCISPNWPERGSELVFVSTRSGSMDLWIATWEPAGEAFLRGDCNSDGRADLSDAVCILDSLFRGITAPGCHASANANGDESVNISDPTFLLNHLFLGGPAPVAPFPDCGPSDLETDAALGCVESSCP